MINVDKLTTGNRVSDLCQDSHDQDDLHHPEVVVPVWALIFDDVDDVDAALNVKSSELSTCKNSECLASTVYKQSIDSDRCFN